MEKVRLPSEKFDFSNEFDYPAVNQIFHIHAFFLQKYFASGPGKQDISSLVLEWTNQHGCGKDDKKNNRKTNCDFIIQYMIRDDLRDGINTQTQDFTDNKDNGTWVFFFRYVRGCLFYWYVCSWVFFSVFTWVLVPNILYCCLDF